MNTNIFLNIIILFNPNYDNSKINGTVKKSISIMDQFVAFYNSIKSNVKLIKYDISITHFEDFSNEDLLKLSKLDVNVIKTNSCCLTECGIERYIVKTKIKGTHRLIAETDMLLLKEPNFNWNVDFQKMYAGSLNIYPEQIINKIHKIFNIKNKYKDNYKVNPGLFISYNVKKINKNKLYPHFNNGLTLIKEDFSEKYYKKIISLNYTNKKFKYFDKRYHHHLDQFFKGLILLELTDNWEPFEPGINYLLKVYDVNKFGKQNISLLHYCGVGADELVQKQFPEYFK